MRLEQVPPGRQIRAYLVHLYTASGVAFAFLATAELCRPAPEPRRVFAWLLVAVVIDSTDGPLARRWQVKQWAHRISGRAIDDIVDYLTFTFIPLLLVWRLGWVPAPAGLWVVPAMMVSLLGFANVGAKEETEGFFRGFPSYWNFYAYYGGLMYMATGPLLPGLLLLLLILLTVLPVRFIYPNLAPPPWRRLILLGGGLWLMALFFTLPWYPGIPAWFAWLTLLYPLFYTAVSLRLDLRSRRSSPD